jgi:hypothetical protein
MSTTSVAPYGSGFSPLLGEPRMGLVPIPTKTATADTLTTSGGVRTATAAECLGGLFILNVDDAQTMTLPTATLLNAAIPACHAGASFDIDIINIGDSTLTVAVGTGGTLVVGNSKSTVATLVTAASKRFTILVTGVTQDGDASDSYTVYGYGSIAAAVA